MSRVSKTNYSVSKLKAKIAQVHHVNPYSKKRITKATKSKIPELNKLKEIVQDQFDALEDSEINPDLERQYYKLLSDLAQYDQPLEDLDSQLKDLSPNKHSMGMMDFKWDIDCNDTYINAFTLLLGKSKSGKSVLVNNLIYELPQSFDKIVFFMGKDSWKNKCPQTLNYVANRAGMKTQWINTDSDIPPEYSEDPEALTTTNPDGSAVCIFKNTEFGSVYIFDDLYTKPSTHWVVNFMDTIAVMGRHMKINAFICFQGFTKLSSKILDNTTRIFMFNEILGREDLWRKLKIMPPDNLDNVLRDISNGYNTRWYYLDDTELEEYTPYDMKTQQQCIRKMASKLPKSIKDSRIAKERADKQAEMLRLRAELGIPDPDADVSSERDEPKTVMLTDIRDAQKIDPKDWNQTAKIATKESIPRPKTARSTRVQSLRSKYKF